MPKSYVERIRDAGVVGAGGAGFPTDVKVDNNAEIIIANGIECEPLLKSDQQVMKDYADEIIEGIYYLLHISEAPKGVICIKEEYQAVAKALQKAIGKKEKVEIFTTDSYYPAGDEQQLIYEVTGKRVPSDGLPIDVGVIVNNVSTLRNIYQAIENEKPVTSKHITVAGEVNEPSVFKVPVGTTVEKLIELAGGFKDNQKYRFILGGPAMGEIKNNWQLPITKTDAGIIVLPVDHSLITKKSSSLEYNYKVAKSVCCQCSDCTQLCPRNSLGFNLEPHKVMRAINYNDARGIDNVDGVFACCDCGLCTFYACDMGLSPHRMVAELRDRLSEKGYSPEQTAPEQVNEYREYQKAPTVRLIQKMGLSKYQPAVYSFKNVQQIKEVKIPLRQHIGVPAEPVILEGDSVNKGDLIAKVNDNLGAQIHASIAGVISEITDRWIIINQLS